MTTVVSTVVSKITAAAEKATSLLATASLKSKAILSDVLQVSRTKLEYVAGIFFVAYEKTVQELTTVSETFSKTVGKNTTETAVTSETVTRTAGFNRTNTETAPTVETITTIRGFNRTNTETTPTVETITTIRGFNRTNTETASAAEVISSVRGFNRTTTDSVLATDDYLGEAVIDDDQFSIVGKNLTETFNVI